MSELLTIPEAAVLLTVSARTVKRLQASGQLKSVSAVVGRRFELSEIERYILANTSRRAGPLLVELPPRFTLYRFFDDEGALLYVGITSTGAQRWTQHSKYQSWWTEVATIRVEHLPSLKDLLAAEASAIKAENPRYNKAGR